MKNTLYLLLIFVISLIAIQDTIAATIDEAPATVIVNKTNTALKPTYSGDTIAAGVTQVIRLTGLPDYFVNISAWNISCASTDYDAWISETENAAITDAGTSLAKDGINLGYSRNLSSPEYFRNGDTTEIKALYLTIKNDDSIATGAWTLKLTYPDISN